MTKPSFRAALQARQALVGTFVKTPSHQVVEVLASTPLDYLVLDAEHAPFDAQALDVCMLAARANQKPALVRIPDSHSSTVLRVLDMGATGLIIPHAVNPQGMSEVVRSAHYRNGTRGFSNSPRAGAYGLIGMGELIAEADRETTLIFQIEDASALDCLESLVNVEGADGFLIGRADLAVSLGVGDIAHPAVSAATERICRACDAAKKPVGIFLPDAREISRWKESGVSLFLIGSDQSYLRAQAASVQSQLIATH
ncbi:HpcH/HpaI aldolase family protein [Ottowia thiooxydans]|uniref:HpcH/HpaI aldolase family protein n=1 Tax=Ottowia thiooxydans TaxID=219182 RepID=UPI0004008F66|nr:aldolase/citrate lyase family protein [Ottowia thiooxydans]